MSEDDLYFTCSTSQAADPVIRDVQPGEVRTLGESVGGQHRDLVVTEVQPDQAPCLLQPAGRQDGELVTGKRQTVESVKT